MARTKGDVMDEIRQLDVQIDRALKEMPAPSTVEVQTFPWGFWVLAAIFLALFFYNEGALLGEIHPVLKEYDIVFVILGACFAVWALFVSIKSLFGFGAMTGRKYRKMNAELQKLRNERAKLQDQLREIKE